jgi:hypothetical protein
MITVGVINLLPLLALPLLWSQERATEPRVGAEIPADARPEAAPGGRPG